MTTKLYVYDVFTDTPHRVVAVITGPDSEAVEAEAERQYSAEQYGYTFTPAFGFVGGLVIGDDVTESDL